MLEPRTDNQEGVDSYQIFLIWQDQQNELDFFTVSSGKREFKISQ